MSDASQPQATWSEDDSAVYRAIAAIAVPERREQIAALLTLLPFGVAEPFRVVELAAGEGVLARAILHAFPQATLIALDGSSSMRAHMGQLLGTFGQRARIEAFDIATPAWYPYIQGADVVVSSLCVHHLPGAAKQEFFREVVARLSPRGALLIADLIMPRRLEARELFAATWDRDAAAQSQAQTGSLASYDEFVRREWNYYRFPDPVDQPSPLYDQLRWLQTAGLGVVDCFWLRAGHAIYGGYQTASSSAPPIEFAAALQAAEEALAANDQMLVNHD